MDTPKSLQQKYNKTQKSIPIRLSTKEIIVLKSMAEEDGWINISGFIKNKVFGRRVNYEYKKLISKHTKNSLEIYLKEQTTNLVQQVAYINARMNFELDKISTSGCLDAQNSKRILSKIIEAKQCFINRTEQFLLDNEKILQYINNPSQDAK